MKNSEDFGLSLRTVINIRKYFDESKGDYESTAARKSHSDPAAKKRSP